MEAEMDLREISCQYSDRAGPWCGNKGQSERIKDEKGNEKGTKVES